MAHVTLNIVNETIITRKPPIKSLGNLLVLFDDLIIGIMLPNPSKAIKLELKVCTTVLGFVAENEMLLEP